MLAKWFQPPFHSAPDRCTWTEPTIQVSMDQRITRSKQTADREMSGSYAFRRRTRRRGSVTSHGRLKNQVLWRKCLTTRGSGLLNAQLQKTLEMRTNLGDGQAEIVWKSTTCSRLCGLTGPPLNTTESIGCLPSSLERFLARRGGRRYACSGFAAISHTVAGRLNSTPVRCVR